ISGKISCDHVHMFISYKPQISLSKLVQYLKGISSRILLQEFTHLWARGYMAVSSGNITDEMIQHYLYIASTFYDEEDLKILLDTEYL
ncbi:IS200/IS605 family transposase, partial [Rickettsia sp. R1]